PAQGLQQDGWLHALHPQLSLLAGGALAALLAVDVRDIGLLHLILRQGPLQIIADDEPGPVAVRQDDEPPLLRQAAEEGQLLPVVEYGEAPQGDNGGINHLAQGVLVVAALHHDDLSDLPHRRCAPSRTSSSFSSPTAS